MIKAIYLLKRKPGISREAFREHYEGHARLAHRYLGHLMIRYERNYPTDVRASRSQGRRPVEWDYDCIAEWVLPSREALEEVYRIFSDPEVHKVFHDDEEKFLDRDAVTVIICDAEDVVNTGTGGGHAWLERKAGPTV